MVQLVISIRTCMVAVALLAVTGCGSTPPSNHYLLDEPAATRLSGIDRGSEPDPSELSLEIFDAINANR